MKTEIDDILLRPAALSDARLLYEWRNDPQTRLSSHNQEEINFNDHFRWLTNSLENENRKLYIALLGKTPVGTVRSDCNDGIYELSWTVAPQFRGQGIGKRMVTLLAEQINGPVRAEVLVENQPSLRIAEAAGMHLEFTKDGVMHFYRCEHLLENCPLCNRKVAKLAFNKKEYSYKRCVNCGTLFVANHLHTDTIYTNYSESYFEANSPISNANKERRGYPSYMEAQESLKRSFMHKLHFIHRFSKDKKLLDIGAAYGTFLTLARQYHECYGLDVSQYAAQVAREHFGVDVRQANIEQSIPFPDNHFDIVVMWDVIEHLVNPIQGLREVYRVLRPGGYVFISTDDANNWLPRLFGANWWALAAPLHLCHFSKKGMEIAIRQSGEFERINFSNDSRDYKIGEIISHFGVSYKNKVLLNFGEWLEQTSLGSTSIKITRPEQFIAFAQKK